MSAPPSFDDDFRRLLRQLFLWRRDVRRFKRDALPDAVLNDLLELACLAPSVGLSEPWRFVNVRSPEIREQVRKDFEQANEAALSGYKGAKAEEYARLKLSGLEDAPVHLAVFTDRTTTQGHGLGRQTMPETLDYSVVTAIHTLWLAARAHNVGVGWVSILDPIHVAKLLNVPASWSLTAYLCIGYPEEESDTPELERANWEHRGTLSRCMFER